MKEHVPRCVRRYLENPAGNYLENTTLVNASLRLSVVKHLLQNPETCVREYNNDRFKILRSCRSDFQLKVYEAVMILTLEPTLCIQREFDFTTALI